MRTLVSITVAATIALHTVLGCCWHHAHASMPARVAAQAKTGEPIKPLKRCSCSRKHKKPTQASEQQTPQQDSKDSCPTPCGEKCSSLAVNRELHREAMPHFFVIWSAMPDRSLLLPLAPKVRGDLLDNIVESPPHRLYQLHQLLLI